jgi:hypothetical protein
LRLPSDGRFAHEDETAQRIFVSCAPPQAKNDGEKTSSGDGLSGLVAAAKKEGGLNVIALPPDWANDGAIIKAFGDEYGIKVNSTQPDAAGQDEIYAASQQNATVAGYYYQAINKDAPHPAAAKIYLEANRAKAIG